MKKINFSTVFDMIICPVCPVCGKNRIHFNEYICVPCSQKMERFPLYALSCFQDELFQRGLKFPVFIGFKYNKAMKEMIHRLKYQGSKRLGYYLGTRLGELLIEQRLTHFHYICPVPLHKRRERERGFNQSEEIAHGISKILQIPVLKNAAVRQKYTSTQTLLTREERKKNLKGIFQMHPKKGEKIKNSDILVVDDLITTGSTVSELNRIFIENGVNSIVNCAVATSSTVFKT